MFYKLYWYIAGRQYRVLIGLGIKMPFRSEAQRRYLWANHPEIARKWHEEHGTPDDLPYKVDSKKQKKKIGKKKKGADITQPSPRSLRISPPSVENIFPLLQPDPEIQFAMREKTFPSVFRRLFRTKLNLPKPNMLKTSGYYNNGITSCNEENTMLEKLAERFIRNYLRKIGRGLISSGPLFRSTGYTDDDDDDEEEVIDLREQWRKSVTGKPYTPPSKMPEGISRAMPGSKKLQTPVVDPNQIIKGKKLTPEMVPGMPKEEMDELNKVLRERSRIAPPKKKAPGTGGQNVPQPAPQNQPPPPAPQQAPQYDSIQPKTIEKELPRFSIPSPEQLRPGSVEQNLPRFSIPTPNDRRIEHSEVSMTRPRKYLPKISSDESLRSALEKASSDYYHRINLLLRSILGIDSGSDIL